MEEFKPAIYRQKLDEFKRGVSSADWLERSTTISQMATRLRIHDSAPVLVHCFDDEHEVVREQALIAMVNLAIDLYRSPKSDYDLKVSIGDVLEYAVEAEAGKFSETSTQYASIFLTHGRKSSNEAA
jgi:hypothetical protein